MKNKEKIPMISRQTINYMLISIHIIHNSLNRLLVHLNTKLNFMKAI